MTPREALRRAAASALANPNFDTSRITDVDRLRNVLQREYPEYFVCSGVKRIGAGEQLKQASPVRS
jgi:hypothetical protein